MHTFFNPSPYREELKNLDFNKLYCVVLNQLEAKEFSGENTPNACLNTLHARYPHLRIVITLGKDGCLYYDGEKVHQQSAFPVVPVDTTAAGDTFSGYFVAGLYRNETPEKILKKASMAAAIATTRKGAAPSIPLLEEVEEKLLDIST
jgi:ribokinase